MKRRAKVMWFLAVIGCGTLFAILHNASQEPDLLGRAHFVATGNQWKSSDSFTLVSDSRLLCQPDFRYNPGPQSSLFWFDTETKAASYDPALQARVDGAYRISPDLKWILSGNLSNIWRERLSYDLVPMDGGTTTRHQVDSNFMGVKWCLDSRHWIEFSGGHVAPPGTSPENSISYPMEIQHVAIRSLDDPQRMRKVEISPKSLLREPSLLGDEYSYRNMLVLSPDRFLTWRRMPFPSPSPDIVVREMDLQSPNPLHKYILTPPGRRFMTQLVPSPHGDRFPWKLREPLVPNPFVSKVLRRLFNGQTYGYASGSSRMSLWVSQIDGSEMHELGVMPPTANRMVTLGQYDTDSGEIFGDRSLFRLLRWLPDGKHVSFTYKYDLYTVSTE